jgi:inorganic pyrophosphatase
MHKLHPWHGLSLGKKAPEQVHCYIEMVPTDTVKYELDKESGLLKVDRPQKYSSLCPMLYGLLPRTYAGERVAEFCRRKTGLSGLVGDGDPLDICVLTENTIVRGDVIVQAIPIGGFRLLDRGQVDDKIIGVMVDDLVFGGMHTLDLVPRTLIQRLRHYFMTYKDDPDATQSQVNIAAIYGREEALEIIQLGCQDYREYMNASC